MNWNRVPIEYKRAPIDLIGDSYSFHKIPSNYNRILCSFTCNGIPTKLNGVRVFINGSLV